jgi:hypothetical protein
MFPRLSCMLLLRTAAVAVGLVDCIFRMPQFLAKYKPIMTSRGFELLNCTAYVAMPLSVIRFLESNKIVF